SQTGTTVTHVRLGPLPRDTVRQLVADALRCAPAHAGSLADLVHQKTGGNPFFVTQFLNALSDEGLLTFDHGRAEWSWNVDSISAKRSVDRAVELMLDKFRRLPHDTQSAVQRLSCLGHDADVELLSCVLGKPESQVHSELWEAVRLELIARTASSYGFAHDRI